MFEDSFGYWVTTEVDELHPNDPFGPDLSSFITGLPPNPVRAGVANPANNLLPQDPFGWDLSDSIVDELRSSPPITDGLLI